MKIKFNWGTGIVISLVFFMLVTSGMMILFINQKVDLVTDNYYDKELKFQQQIDKVNNTHQLAEKVEMKYDGEMIQIKFPLSFVSSKPTGEIFFYRPSDNKKDFKLPLVIDDKGVQFVPVSGLANGYWKIQLNWLMNESEYFNELSFVNE